jgi:hypothetical protein
MNVPKIFIANAVRKNAGIVSSNGSQRAQSRIIGAQQSWNGGVQFAFAAVTTNVF